MKKTERIYMDYGATTPVLPEVLSAMETVLRDDFGNPSSLHEEGRKARARREEARGTIAGAVGAETDEIFFTSGGTESDHLAILGIARGLREKGNHVITSVIEHSAVLGACKTIEEEGFEITYLPVTPDGLVEPAALAAAIRKETILISIMIANNEIGTVQPILELIGIARSHGIRFHTDAVQAFPHLPVDAKTLGVDALSISGHKIYAPKGIGALYLKKGTPFRPLTQGGEQERKVRPGTENAAGIAGFGKAVEILLRDREKDAARILPLRDMLRDGLLSALGDVLPNGHPEKRLPNNVNISFRHADGESILIHLDLEGIACSLGSACAAGAAEPSHVLRAIGRSGLEAKSSIRFTLGKFSERRHVERVLEVLPPFVKKLRSASALPSSRAV